MSGASSYAISTFIRNPTSRNSKIISGNSMKILGFHFDSDPTIDYNMSMLFKKFRKRLWLLRNLKKARASAGDLVDCYCCFLRSVLDYCCNVYHPMLSKTQSNALENLQFTALKIIFGYDMSKESMLQKSGLTSLKERREKLFLLFCNKTYNNKRLERAWLEARDFEGPNVRRQKIIVEKFASTARLYNSPLFTIRRTLNDTLVT